MEHSSCCVNNSFCNSPHNMTGSAEAPPILDMVDFKSRLNVKLASLLFCLVNVLKLILLFELLRFVTIILFLWLSHSRRDAAEKNMLLIKLPRRVDGTNSGECKQFDGRSFVLLKCSASNPSALSAFFWLFFSMDFSQLHRISGFFFGYFSLIIFVFHTTFHIYS